MFHNYLLTALRHLRRNKFFTAIHLAGLSIGMACCILIALFIQDEMRYVEHHTRGDRIYRVLHESDKTGTGKRTVAWTSAALAPAMLEAFPEVESAARLLDDWWVWVKHEDRKKMLDVALGDASLLDMFDIELARGDPNTIFDGTNSAVITERVARTFYDDADPIGKTITVEDDKLGGVYTVTGVMKDMSRYATVTFDILTTQPSLGSPAHFKQVFNAWRATERWRPFNNYVMFREGARIEDLEARLPAFEARHLGEEVARNIRYRLQPIERIRHYAHVDYGMNAHRSIDFLNRLGLIGGVLLLIACANFMNLATAQASLRAKEVGLRKVVGAGRGHLILQFLGESVLIAGAALVLAYAIAQLALPSFGDLIGWRGRSSPGDLGWILSVIVLIVGFVAGGYPALFLSRFQPVETLKGRLDTTRRGRGLRKGLVVFQFGVSGVMIFAAIVVYQQTVFMSEKDLGYDKELLVHLPVERYEHRSSWDTMKQAFGDHPNILGVTASSASPGTWNRINTVSVQPEGEPVDHWRMHEYGIDADFLDVFGMELVTGRNLRPSRTQDRDAVLLNETAVRRLGWEEPIGRRFEIGEKAAQVVGVVKDFHIMSLQHPIIPVVMHYAGRHFITVKIRGEDIPVTMAHLRKTWDRFLPGVPFEPWFADKRLERHYFSERNLGKTCVVFSILTIFVACLGLFGLASFTAERRTKEIGIRKVLGATVADIVSLFSRDFVKLVILANLIGVPIAYRVMGLWLETFPYRIALSAGPVLWCIGATLAIALLTVSYQSIKAGSSDPVDTLRCE